MVLICNHTKIEVQIMTKIPGTKLQIIKKSQILNINHLQFFGTSKVQNQPRRRASGSLDHDLTIFLNINDPVTCLAISTDRTMVVKGSSAWQIP